MLPLLFAMIVFLFMLVGAVAFLTCILIPQFRRYALSTALWFASWGPCLVAMMTIAGLALVPDAFITKNGDPQSFHCPKLLSAFGWGYLIVGTLSTAVVATATAWLHQLVVRRLTFALFRLYATAVVAGIGSVLGWSMSWWLFIQEAPHVWVWSLLCMLLLTIGFGTATFKCARQLRGKAPRNLTWISPEEYAG